MLASLVGAAVLALVGLACAHPDADTFDTVDVSKRDLEFNQYVPGYRLRGEPSCEELREMWRLSKREARRATTTNQLPRNRPYTYGRLVAFAPDPNARPTANVYGSTWHYPPAKSAPSNSPYKDRFEDLRRMLGMAGDRRGNYDKLQQKVAAMRGPGRSSKGKYDELRRIVTLERQEPRPVALSLSAPKEAFQRSSKTRREPAAMSPRTMRGSTHFSQQGFVGPLLPADSRGSSFTPWQPPAPDPAVVSVISCSYRTSSHIVFYLLLRAGILPTICCYLTFYKLAFHLLLQAVILPSSTSRYLTSFYKLIFNLLLLAGIQPFYFLSWYQIFSESVFISFPSVVVFSSIICSAFLFTLVFSHFLQAGTHTSISIMREP